MNNSIGLDFITRTIRTTGIVLLVYFPFGLYYEGFYATLAVFSGGIWAIINLLFTTMLIKATVRPDGVDTVRAFGLAFVKFPLLYLSGYALTQVPYFDTLHLLYGFTSLLGVIVLKAVGMSLFSPDESAEKKNAEGIA